MGSDASAAALVIRLIVISNCSACHFDNAMRIDTGTAVSRFITDDSTVVHRHHGTLCDLHTTAFSRALIADDSTAVHYERTTRRNTNTPTICSIAAGDVAAGEGASCFFIGTIIYTFLAHCCKPCTTFCLRSSNGVIMRCIASVINRQICTIIYSYYTIICT